MNEKHIKNLSNIELVENMKKLVSSERRLLVSFLAHLSEVSQRRLHLESGFSNLVDYCTTTFGISEGSAYKRMQVARASRKFPLILDYIKEQKISLTVACMLCPHLDIDNFKEKLDMAVKKTKRQLEKLIAGWVQRQEPEESIRKVPVCSSVREKNYAGSGFGGQTLELGRPSESDKITPTFSRPAIETVKPVSEKRVCLRFTVGEQTEAKLQRAKEVLASKKDFSGSLEQILDMALEALLEKNDPMKRRQKQKENQKTDRPGKTDAKKQSRYIPQRIRDLVLEKAGYQCSYISLDGKRCTCRTALQIDHIHPYAKAGSNDFENLQVFCPSHNLFKAQLDFGKNKIDKFATNRSSRP